MLRHTLSVLRSSGGLRGIVVIGPDPEVGDVALALGVAFLPESGAGGLNGALAQAAASVAVHHAQGMLVIPGDLPRLRPSSIRELVRPALPRPPASESWCARRCPAASSSRRIAKSLARMRCWWRHLT